MKWCSVFIIICLVGCYPQANPDVNPSSDLSASAELSVRVYADKLADVHQQVAEKIKSGEFTEDSEFDVVLFVQEKSKEAREDSFELLKKPTGDAGGLLDIEVNQQLELGFRKAAKR